jgi:hypothetical protein
MNMQITLTYALAFFIFLANPFAASAQSLQEVDLELVMLADASGSIDDTEIQFQRQGYAQAIMHPDVLAAIKKGTLQKIAVTFVEWGDDTSQEVVVGWTVIDVLASAETFAKALLKPPRLAFGSNAIGSALAFAHKLIKTNKLDGLRKVIDFSADSANNWNGPPIAEVRQIVLADRITINGLAILCRTCDTGRPIAYNLEKAFKDQIIGGPGSFVITADSKAKFAEAVRRKLVLEIAMRHSIPRTRPSDYANLRSRDSFKKK